MATVQDVASYILRERGAMSAMKLQKLVYYSQAWHLVWAEEPLFDAEIEAWANGPVVRELFNTHRGRFNVSAPWPKGDADALTKYERGTIDAVLSTYGELSGRTLSQLTHDEAPWREARQGLSPTDRSSVPVDLDRMQDFYSGLDLDEEAMLVKDLPRGD